MESSEGSQAPVSSVQHPRPLGSLVASAKRLTGQSLERFRPSAKGWQDDAWDMFDKVGEERFLASTLAGRLAQARLFVGELGDDPTQPPEPVTEGVAAEVFAAFGQSPAHRAQLIARLGVNLFVAGDGYLVGVPRSLLPDDEEAEGGLVPTSPTELTTDVSDLEWRMLSVSEVDADASGDQVTLHLGASAEDDVSVAADDIFLIRVWRPHPRKWWEADSPTRSSLPVLRELVGLTMHISAQIDSRLAGAGILLVPQSAADAIGRDAEDPEQAFTDALLEAMVTPIKDRSSAAAVVPLTLSVPDETTDQFQYLSFATPLDAQLPSLRDEAIRRLALGQDAPPEILLGVGGMNHWGAWLVREDTISTHIEPPLALICDALTTQFLHPVLAEQGVDEPAKYVIWFDVSHMIMRPNRTTDAQALHAAGVISDAAYRDAAGFDDTDAPEELGEDLDPAINMALDLVKRSPSLAQMPGLVRIVQQLRQVLADDIPAPVTAKNRNSGQSSTPRTSGPPADGTPTEEPGESTAQPAAVPATPSPVGNPNGTVASGYTEEVQQWLDRHLPVGVGGHDD